MAVKLAVTFSTGLSNTPSTAVIGVHVTLLPIWYSANTIGLFPAAESFTVAVRLIAVLSGTGLGAATTLATTGATPSGGTDVADVVVTGTEVVGEEVVVVLIVVVVVLVVGGMVVVIGAHACSHCG